MNTIQAVAAGMQYNQLLTDYIIFTDNWWNVFIHEYAITIGILWALLKCLAMFDATNKSNTVLESFRNMITGGECLKWKRRATDKKSEDLPTLKKWLYSLYGYEAVQKM